MDTKYMTYDYPKIPAPHRQHHFSFQQVNVYDNVEPFGRINQNGAQGGYQNVNEQTHSTAPASVPCYELPASNDDYDDKRHEITAQPTSTVSTFQEQHNDHDLEDIEKSIRHSVSRSELPQKPEVAKLSKNLSIWPSQVALDRDRLGGSKSVQESNVNPPTISNIPPQTFEMPINNYNYPSKQTYQQGESWHHSLFSCAEPTTCMTALFCPCITYSRTQYRLNRKAEHQDPTNMLGYSTINGTCIAWSLLCGIHNILAGVQKGRIRRAYEMDSGSGNLFGDCLQGCCCCCCVLARNEKEVTFREEQMQETSYEVYESPGPMVFSPPPASMTRTKK